MALENRKLEVGTKLEARYKKEVHQAEVVAGEGDKTLIRLAAGREFTSPSSAGAAVKGSGKTCDGWEFWSLEGAEEEKPSQPKAKAKKASKAKKEGDRKIACGDCGQEFETSREAADHMRVEHNAAEAAPGNIS